MADERTNCGHADLEILVDHKGDPVKIVCHICGGRWEVQESDWDVQIATMKC